MPRKIQRYGWIPDLPDQRDFIYAPTVTAPVQLPASVDLRVRWSPYLRLIDAGTHAPVTACVGNVGGWTRLDVPRAGTFTVVSPFDPGARFRSANSDCVDDAAGR